MYIPGHYQSGGGCGIDADTNRWCVDGAQVSDLYATCVIRGGTDACASNPCQNGATCMAGQNQYTCSCTFGWTGDHCSERHIFHNDEKCYQLSSDALNHANAETKCTTLGGSLAAIKDREEQTFLANQISQGSDVSYWIGLKSAPNTFIFSDFSQLGSSIEWVPGEPDNLCVLLDKDGGYKCKTDLCHASHNYVCQSDITRCGQNVCQNGGNCTSCFNDEKVFCDCAPGFTGEKCEINVNECDSSPCQFGGTCVDGVDSYTCICVPGYRGDDCETDIDLCNPNVCPFGWTCVDAGISMHCYAFGQGRTGDHYKCMDSSCPTGMLCAEAGPDSYSCIYG
ncbi:fibropellin-1-like [Branchiostoma floridae x Branchiostoma japonicum]